MTDRQERWTPAQSLALRRRGNTVVSAAAGSGKTSTLTEKIVRILSRKGGSLDDMLVVTYSRAAAAELKTKIREKLEKKMEEDPSVSDHLNAVSSAAISTIHSFYLDVLKDHYGAADLSPGLAVLDDSEAGVMKLTAAEETVDDLFEIPSDSVPEDAMGLSDLCAVFDGIDKFVTYLTRIADRLAVRGEDASKLGEYADRLDEYAGRDFSESPWGKVIAGAVAETAEHYASVIEKLLPVMDGDAPKYIENAEKLAEWTDGLRTAAGGTWDELRSFMRHPFSDRVYGKNLNPNGDPFVDSYRANRAAFKDLCDNKLRPVFAESNDEIGRSMRETARFIRGLAIAVDAFFKKFAERKRERGKVDYQDLETGAYKLLVEKDGGPTPLAVRIGKKYKYIFVDEYQDTNGVQDAIFRAVGANSELFFVGDVKQSVYSFRGAEPEIFSRYREEWESVFPDGGDGEVTEPRSAGVFMSENFRCSEPVIRFANAVSRSMFPYGSTPYCENDELVFSSKFEPPVTDPVTVCLVASSGTVCEERYVAEKIRSMIGKKLYGDKELKPSDFAIILSSVSSDGARFADALAAAGVPSAMSDGVVLENESEVILAIDLLHAIDNPYRDGPLAGVMFSSLFGFTVEDLVNVRTRFPDGPFFTSVIRTAEEGDPPLSEKCASFCDRIRDFRLREKATPAVEFIEYVFSETGILFSPEVTAKAHGAANLTAILDEARKYEEGAFRGLYGFLSYIDTKIGAGTLSVNDSKADAVSITTIHKSKGLEYPVCFICRTDKMFTFIHNPEKFPYDRELGVAVPLPDPGGYSVRIGPVLRAIREKTRTAEEESEMRKLYVAMTRAKHKLFVTGKTQDPAEKFAGAADDAAFADRFTVMRAKSHLDWILSAIGRDPSICETVPVGGEEPAEEEASGTAEERSEAADVSAARAEVDDATGSFGFDYPLSFLEGVPAKLAVSRLYPEALDGDDGAADLGADRFSPDAEMPYPSFMTGTFDHTPARRGTANHVFMQFTDYEKLKSRSVEDEIERLVGDGFMTREMGDLVVVPWIEAFRKSALFARLGNAAEIRREFRFNVRLPAWKFTADEELAEKYRAADVRVTVQGVFDCVFRDSDGRLVVVDYKTDAMSAYDRSHPDEFRNKLREKHRLQLSYYREAAALLFGAAPDEVLIYSLPLEDTVEVTG